MCREKASTCALPNVSDTFSPIFFFIPEKYAYRQQKGPFLFIYTQQWLPKARFEKKIEGVYLKIFLTN